jgi:hypothetical protein
MLFIIYLDTDVAEAISVPSYLASNFVGASVYLPHKDA